MTHRYFFLIIALIIPLETYSQKPFSVNIQVNNTIQKDSLSFFVDDGQRPVTFHSVNNEVRLTGELATEATTLTIRYKQAATILLISDKPASISLYYKDNDLNYAKLSNTLYVFDTINNKYYSEIYRYRLPELHAYLNFWKGKDNDAYRNDSLFNINKQLLKNLCLKALPILKKYPDKYYSFWFFYNKVIMPSLNILIQDTAYVRTLYNFLRNDLDKRFLKTEKGQMIADQLQGILHPAILMHPAPVFAVKDIYGNNIQLNPTGKYLLLNFWASWCGPCIVEMPFYQALQQTFPANKLDIVGVNMDRNMSDCAKIISDKDMNWIQVFDQGRKISNSYGIKALPTTVVIDDKGIIIYRKEGIDTSNLRALLNSKLL